MSVDNISPWLDKLPFQWDSIKKHGIVRYLKKDEFLFHDRDHLDNIFIIESGRIRLYLITTDGKEKTVSIIGQNGLLGEHFLSRHNSHITSAVAVSNSKLIQVNKNTFEKLVLDDKTLTKQWVEILSMKLEILTHSSLQLSFESSTYRVVNAFIQLATTYGFKERDGSIKITIKFTHQELADLIGTTRVTVSNLLKTLYNLDLVFKKNGYYYVKNLEQLKKSSTKFLQDETCIL